MPKTVETASLLWFSFQSQLDEKSEAYKAGYRNICEIGKERIRRAGEKIKEEKRLENIENLDVGFKVLKLDTSNIRKWQPDYDNLEQSLLDICR
jgi:adenine-specific DNA-methyltransferase